MSLRGYRRPRMVVLHPRSTALEAARALENNEIGAVIVQEHGRVVGMVTDRDLAIRVLGRRLDPEDTPLSKVMTSPVATLSPRAHPEDAIRVMVEANVRRVPLVEDDRLVGMVTFDDLLLDDAVPSEMFTWVIQAQIGEGGPAEPARTSTRMRRQARADATLHRLLELVRQETGLERLDQAEVALERVLDCLVRRLTPEEANHLIAQLPSRLQPALWSLPAGPDRSITREAMEAQLARLLDVVPARAAHLLEGVGATLARSISPGQMEDVRGQLPRDLRPVFTGGTPEPPIH